MKILTLIFSMNRTENVIKLANLIKDYVDEIVIIDSSLRRNFEILKRKLKFAKVYWLPPELMQEVLRFKNRNELSAKVFY